MLTKNSILSKDKFEKIKQNIYKLLEITFVVEWLLKGLLNSMSQDSSACSPIDIHGHGLPFDTHKVSSNEPLCITDSDKV